MEGKNEPKPGQGTIKTMRKTGLEQVASLT